MHNSIFIRKDGITRRNQKNIFTKKRLSLSVFSMVNVEVRC